MNEMLLIVLYGLCGLIIMLGVVLQTKATLDQGMGKGGFGKFFAMLLKYSGFAMLAFLLIKFETEHLVLNLVVFFLSSIVTFLLYLLARRVSLR
ncbi:hypothetical protein [Fluviispira sanaruensis]|uniref:Uncharacterized protein n=1 Tax=Fluviispira sanaruensis TaxID=2493639 RepID=A0A4P2VQE0_FLUSA|nr:hypothetical protein [Fluviispira sanaruensis]BBH54610.1 hypothetical protein JCM31447_30840 [Fluviispira sanaruensis]